MVVGSSSNLTIWCTFGVTTYLKHPLVSAMILRTSSSTDPVSNRHPRKKTARGGSGGSVRFIDATSGCRGDWHARGGRAWPWRPAFAHSQAGVLIGAEETPELEVVIAR